MANKKAKEKIVNVRFTVDEKKMVEKAARKDRRAISSFIRVCALDVAEKIINRQEQSLTA